MFVCRGKSFRARSNTDCIRYGETAATIGSSWHSGRAGGGGQFSAQVLLAAAGERRLSLQGKPQRQRAAILSQIPVVFVAPHNLNLIGSSPAFRRTFLNALLLHVLPEYRGLLADYTKCLAERNARLLHQPKNYAQMLAWDTTLAALGERLETAGKSVVRTLISRIAELTAARAVPQIRVSYMRGWNADLSLADALRRSFARDLRYGFSTVGCHRADLSVWCGKVPAMRKLSLGQSYMLGLDFFFAAREQMENSLGTPALLMLDDVMQRLDNKNGAFIRDFLLQRRIQALVTVSEQPAYWKMGGNDDAGWQLADDKLARQTQ